ncbi:family 78 glycoside hydrolase catalytic domain [Paenibacillus sp. JZ16]|uniref:family 78 glycoside hydrolase catalytic domain n=1 Tax=Paenibacillus sp. JZ16 TaxID=1906272 RepID=UPI00188BA1AA|nr:family 78 glycoside hydrolase catalytic domain [Paenibacillus sp. JZ16]
MNQPSVSNWRASWIWGAGCESPRNEWRCFRHSFVPEGTLDQALLKLTADSRYVLYVNGEQVGRGPVRSWPFELAYDEYEIGHLLRAGQENVIAVLVIHYGISTFQYLRGRAGLLVQLDRQRLTSPSESVTISDESWKTAVHSGYDSSSSRISCQLGFTEILDARGWEEDWIQTGYDDSGWESATAIGPAGMAPWTSLVERDIPYLTEEPLYPSHVESLRAVRPAAWSAVLDLRSILFPESSDHANVIEFCGLIATLIRMEQAAPLTVGMVDSGRTHARLSVNGHWLSEDRYVGEVPERYTTFELESGEHLLLIDVTGSCHGHGFHIGFDSSASFTVHAPALGPEYASSAPFVSIGPFDVIEDIDHQPRRLLERNHPDYAKICSVASLADLKTFGSWIHPIKNQLVNLNDVFTSCVWKVNEQVYPVPSAMQQAVLATPHSASIPVYAGLDTEIVIDFGRELSGYIAIELDASSGTIVDGYGFEYMSDGWRQHTYLVDNTFRYVCKEGRQSYVSVVRRGLRYLALTLREASRPVKLHEIKLIQSNYPVANVGSFRSSDPLLNDIWAISRDTTRLCMEDTFVDCPAFEQVYWVGDARNEALVSYYTFGAKEIVSRCLKLVPGSSCQTLLYVDQVPSGWNSVIPNWTFFWVTACLEYYHYHGEVPFIVDIWPHVNRTLEQYLKLQNDKGLLERSGWNLLDWAPMEQPREGVVTPQNMFMVKALRDAAEIGDTAGESAVADQLRKAADKLRDAIDLHLWDEERAAYVDCIHADGRYSATTSMQTQIVAYLCDIANGDRKSTLERYITDPPERFVQAGSPFMLFFYYEALTKLGRPDLLVADMRKNYGYMIEHGATSCWEMFPWSGYHNNPRVLTRSHCHAWSAAPAYFLGHQVLGVQGLTPGWDKVRVAPQPSGLAWARGTVPLPDNGRIDVSWRFEDEGLLHMRLEVPAHVEVLTEAPAGYDMKVELIRLP